MWLSLLWRPGTNASYTVTSFTSPKVIGAVTFPIVICVIPPFKWSSYKCSVWFGKETYYGQTLCQYHNQESGVWISTLSQDERTLGPGTINTFGQNLSLEPCVIICDVSARSNCSDRGLCFMTPLLQPPPSHDVVLYRLYSEFVRFLRIKWCVTKRDQSTEDRENFMNNCNNLEQELALES